MVVDFVAIPRLEAPRKSVPALEPVSPASSQQAGDNVDGQAELRETAETSSEIISKVGERTDPRPSRSAAASEASLRSAVASADAAAGSSSDDLRARYHAALRATIEKTWRGLTARPFPTGCTLELNQGVGGTVSTSSAAHCALSREDQLQLEAAALMAQPLPYAGFEPAFSAHVSLAL